MHRTLRALKDKELVALTWQGAGSRVVKYVQTFAQRRGLAPDERALLTVLLLRGPQPAGALKTRTERLHRFADRAEVEACLARMAGSETRDGARAAPPTGSAGHSLDPSARPGRGARGRCRTDARRPRVGARGRARGARRARFARRTPRLPRPTPSNSADELAGLPFERWLLRRVVDLADGAPVIEVGTGPRPRRRVPGRGRGRRHRPRHHAGDGGRGPPPLPRGQLPGR